MKTYKVAQVAEQLNIHPSTVRGYCNTGQLKHSTTPAGHRIINQAQLDEFMINHGLKSEPEPAEKKWVHYTRSSNGDKTLTQTQEDLLAENYPEPFKIIRDKGSGLNENRQGYKQLRKLISDGKATDVAITSEDRLSRFGYSYIQDLFNTQGVTIHVLNDKSLKTPEEELLQDFMSLIASFSGKFYRLRGWANQKKLLKKANDEIANREGDNGEEATIPQEH